MASLVFPTTSRSPDKGDASKEKPHLRATACTGENRQRYRWDRKRRHRRERADQEKAREQAQKARQTEEEGRQTCRRAAKASPRLCRAALSTRVFTAFTPCLKKKPNRELTSLPPVNKTHQIITWQQWHLLKKNKKERYLTSLPASRQHRSLVPIMAVM